MRARAYCVLLAAMLGLGQIAWGTIFGTVRGIVHDPQHRPIAGATVKLKSASSDWMATVQTSDTGEFVFNPVALGDYVVTIEKTGFANAEQNVTLASDSSPLLHFALSLPGLQQMTTVTAQPEVANPESATPTTLVNRLDIAQT